MRLGMFVLTLASTAGVPHLQPMAGLWHEQHSFASSLIDSLTAAYSIDDLLPIYGLTCAGVGVAGV